jgi:hypothetical protein
MHKIILVENYEGKRPFGRPMHRREDGVKNGSYEDRFERVDWINLAEDRVRWEALVNTVMNIRII